MSINTEDKELVGLFPGLSKSGFTRISPATQEYNCIAWAMGETHRWWEASNLDGYYWPDNIRDDGSVKSIVSLFRLEGYRRCKDAELEDGYEKVSIWGKNKEFTHVARQLPDGTWTSKIGQLADMSHPSPECLCGVEYGAVKVVMRRKVNDSSKKGTS